MTSVSLPESRTWHAISRSPARVAIGLIVVFSIYRLIVAATLGLGVDKSYGIGVSHDLELSYFDHPPLHYWITHAFIPLLGDGRALRLPFIALFAATSWALYLLTRCLFNAVAGVWAVLALNLSMFFTIAGGWILPDGPLMLGLAAAAYMLASGLFPVAAPPSPSPSPWRTWLGAGFWIGFAGLSKYHAVLFVAGLLLYLLITPGRRKTLLHPAPWAGAAIALIMVAPVLFWNAEHHWASFLYQGGRADAYGGFPKFGQFFTNLGGQILWMGPWVFVPMIVATYCALRQGRASDRSWFCICLGMPAIVLFTLVPLWGARGLPHWQMPGWLMMFPVLGDHLAREALVRSRPRTWAIWSSVTLAIVSVLIVGDAATGYARLLFPAVFAKADPTLEALEWTPLRGELRRRGLLDIKGLFVISPSWIDMGKIDRALDDAMPMLVYGESKQYAFRYDPETLIGHDALILGSRDMGGIAQRLAPYFQSIEELPPFVFGRSGMNEIKVQIFYGHVFKKAWPPPYGESAN